ncbi:SELN-like protein [Mya arenaria]|uniref:SELN-like protein n=1 Tax=Mya arenaria TaxID=6604 RepID=A0ABY7FBE7_MYAAR|nr:SELN-like protein [Mya arenaria]
MTSTPDLKNEIIHSIGDEGVQMFKAFDRNSDNYLSIEEFEPLFHSIMGQQSEGQFLLKDKVYEQPFDETDEILLVKSSFLPLVLSSMTKAQNQGMGGNEAPLDGLYKWKTQHKELENFAVAHFNSFFPPKGTELGSIYHIIEDERGFLDEMTGDLSSNRYYPPDVKMEHIIFHRLLSMFHPRPFIISRFKPRGSIACIRAQNDKYLDIIFRIHAEFQLNELPNFPFWFTPAQFTGHLIVTRDLKHIEHFNLYVPSDKKLNMSLHSVSHSIPASQINDKTPSITFDPAGIQWHEEITETAALKKLEIHMYPFKEHYKFPVMMYVAYSNGTIAHKVNANDFMDVKTSIMENGFAGSDGQYRHFLTTGMARCRQGEVAELKPVEPVEHQEE